MSDFDFGQNYDEFAESLRKYRENSCWEDRVEGLLWLIVRMLFHVGRDLFLGRDR